MRTWIKTIVNKFAISNHTALILGLHALRSYLKLICEYELYSLPNKKVNGAKDHGKNYMKVRPPLVRHLLRNHLFSVHFACLEIAIVRKNQLILVVCNVKGSKLCVDFHAGTFMHYRTFRVWPNFNFPLEQRIKFVLILYQL